MSFNSLFGFGSHSPDASLEGFWPLQETTGTQADDESGNANHATIYGMGSNPVTGAGPNNWLSNAFNFDGADDYVETPSVPLQVGTLIAWAWQYMNTGNTEEDFAGIIGGDVGTSRIGITRTNNGDGGSRLVIENDFNYGRTEIAQGVWHFHAGAFNFTTGEGLYRVDGGTQSDAAISLGSKSPSNLRIGRDYNPGTRYYADKIAGAGYFSRELSIAECEEVRLGPELVNTVAPSVSGTETVGQMLSCTTGTWALPSPFASGSNGSKTYQYQWTRSDDGTGTNEADISGATSSTYTLVSADEAKFIRCRVRGLNTGGFDTDADTESNFTGAIAASGGGGPSGIIWRRPQAQLFTGGIIG